MWGQGFGDISAVDREGQKKDNRTALMMITVKYAVIDSTCLFCPPYRVPFSSPLRAKPVSCFHAAAARRTIPKAKANRTPFLLSSSHLARLTTALAGASLPVLPVPSTLECLV